MKTEKKRKFNMVNSIRRLFKRNPSELEKLLLMFLKGDGYKNLAEEQGRAIQEHNYRLKEIERQRMIEEKYEYLTYRIENGLTMSEDQLSEYDFVKFICEQSKRYKNSV